MKIYIVSLSLFKVTLQGALTTAAILRRTVLLGDHKSARGDPCRSRGQVGLGPGTPLAKLGGQHRVSSSNPVLVWCRS